MGKDGVTNPEQSCRYCKDTGHLLENCLLASSQGSVPVLIRTKAKGGVKLKAPASQGLGCRGGGRFDPSSFTILGG